MTPPGGFRRNLSAMPMPRMASMTKSARPRLQRSCLVLNLWVWAMTAWISLTLRVTETLRCLRWDTVTDDRRIRPDVEDSRLCLGGDVGAASDSNATKYKVFDKYTRGSAKFEGCGLKGSA